MQTLEHLGAETDDDALVIEVEREHALSLTGFHNGLLHALNVGALFKQKRDSLDHGEWRRWFESREFKTRLRLGFRQVEKLIFLEEHRAEVIEANTKSTSFLGIEATYKLMKRRYPSTRRKSGVLPEDGLVGEVEPGVAVPGCCAQPRCLAVEDEPGSYACRIHRDAPAYRPSGVIEKKKATAVPRRREDPRLRIFEPNPDGLWIEDKVDAIVIHRPDGTVHVERRIARLVSRAA